MSTRALATPRPETRSPGEPRRTAISTRGLTKRYGSTVAIADLDLTLAAGEVYGYLGPPFAHLGLIPVQSFRAVDAAGMVAIAAAAGFAAILAFGRRDLVGE